MAPASLAIDHDTHAAVRDYFSTLAARLQGRRAGTAGFGRHGGEEGADWSTTQRQYQQITAVLIGHGLPYLNAYKPSSDYPAAVREAVERYVRNHRQLLSSMEAFVDGGPKAVPSPRGRELDEILRAPPQPGEIPEGPPEEGTADLLTGVDYFGREQRNRSLAEAGGAFVMALEQRRLIEAGCEVYADNVEDISGEYGEGVGYDIHSYEVDGRDRLIKVKTTRFRKETPFYVAANEVAVSARYRERYWIYRVYNFGDTPYVYHLNGPLAERFRLKPHEYRATVR